MMTTPSDRRKAIIYLLAAAVLWSTGGLLIKLIDWQPLAIAGARSAISAVFLLLIFRRPRFTWSGAQLGGAIAYAAMVILFVVSTKLTTAANAILIQYTAPIYVALFGAWFLKERASRLDWLTIFVVLGGLLLFVLDGLTTGHMAGDLCALASGMAYAWLVLCLRKQRSGSPVDSIILGNLITALIGLPFMFDELPSAMSWGGLLLLGIFQLGLSYVLYTSAIKHVTAIEATLIPVIEPLLNPFWVLLMVGERPSSLALLGGLIVVGAITMRGLVQAYRRDGLPDDSIHPAEA